MRLLTFLTKSVERAQETMDKDRDPTQTIFKPVSLEPCELTARPHLRQLTFSINKHRSNWASKWLFWKSIISYVPLVCAADGSASDTPSVTRPLLHHALPTHTLSHTWSGARGGTLLQDPTHNSYHSDLNTVTVDNFPSSWGSIKTHFKCAHMPLLH